MATQRCSRHNPRHRRTERPPHRAVTLDNQLAASPALLVNKRAAILDNSLDNNKRAATPALLVNKRAAILALLDNILAATPALLRPDSSNLVATLALPPLDSSNLAATPALPPLDNNLAATLVPRKPLLATRALLDNNNLAAIPALMERLAVPPLLDNLVATRALLPLGSNNLVVILAHLLSRLAPLMRALPVPIPVLPRLPANPVTTVPRLVLPLPVVATPALLLPLDNPVNRVP